MALKRQFLSMIKQAPVSIDLSYLYQLQYYYQFISLFNNQKYKKTEEFIHTGYLKSCMQYGLL